MLRSVLVVDDEASLRHLLTVILTDRGYQVRAVGGAAAALEELKARDFDVVLTDVRMPGGTASRSPAPSRTVSPAPRSS